MLLYLFIFNTFNFNQPLQMAINKSPCISFVTLYKLTEPMFLISTILAKIVLRTVPIISPFSMSIILFKISLINQGAIDDYFSLPMQLSVPKITLIYRVFLLIYEGSLPVVLVFIQGAFIEISIFIADLSLYQIVIKLPFFNRIQGIANSISFSSTSSKMAFINFIFLYLAPVVVLKSVIKLPNIFYCVRLHHSISMNGFVVLPFPDVPDPIPIFLFRYKQILELLGNISWVCRIIILRQSQRVIERQIQRLSNFLLLFPEQLLLVPQKYCFPVLKWPVSIMKLLLVKLFACNSCRSWVLVYSPSQSTPPWAEHTHAIYWFIKTFIIGLVILGMEQRINHAQTHIFRVRTKLLVLHFN